MSTRSVTPSEPAMRAGDPERGSTAAHLGQAFAQGYLSMEEYETRLGRAFEAETVRALDGLLVDLPVGRIGRRDPQRRAARHAAAGRAVRIHLFAYLAVSVLMIGIWLATAVAAGAWYFWPAWPILGWGIGIVSHAIPVGACGRRASRAADPVVSVFGTRTFPR
ncbi:DUF1707 domain-containing protein [Mycobacterium sp. CSUR Q5927]|nr:DUF1707 domain-containing protein [Mycobacterium sp. CSUR Q5927]